MSVRAVRLGIVALLLGTLTACLEHFGELVTRVSYDPVAQTFEVERHLVDVQPAFLGCHDVSGCVEAIERAMTVQPAAMGGLSDRLLQRLTQSGATDLSLELAADGDQLDVIVRYRAPVGTGAADDTLVRAEWDGKGDRGRYYLVVQAQDSLEPPRKYRSRKVARSGPSGVEWVEEWVLPAKQLDVETHMAVGEGEPMFAAVPGLRAALAERGWLDGAVSPTPAPEPAPDPDPDPDPAPDPEPVPVPVPDPEPPPTPTPASTLAPAPTLAKTYVYEARISGGGLSTSAADLATEPLVPRVSRCYADRQAELPDLGGSVFLSALVKADGSLVSTSVYGQIEDPPLLRCLEEVIESWRFPAWGSGEDVSDVAIPIVFRVEEPPPTRGRKKRK